MKINLGLGVGVLVAAFAAKANSDDMGLTPERLKIYIETLRSMKEPVSTEEVTARLRPIFNPDVKVDVALMDAPNPDKTIGVWMKDKYTYLNLQFPGGVNGLKLPDFNIVAAGNGGFPSCGSDSAWFKGLRVGDVVKMYGPWTTYLDGNTKEDGLSGFSFKSGDLKIHVDGCAKKNPLDIYVYGIRVDWPRPEWDKYYR